MVKLSMEDEGHTQIAVTVPLFLKKLWKMVNDKDAEGVIGWNTAGDGFIIYDQLQFITKLLPQYFKHNNMASFIRQLNFYDFHKVASIDKDEIQFSHNFFVRDLPETLVFIKRKCTSVKSKLTNSVKEEELSDLLSGVKDLKTKHSLVDNELKMLKQENAALWSEINNLRVKHSKQTKVINKIIHFLISYMHSQNSLSKRNGATTRKGSQKNLKTGPTILEIDYHNHRNEQQKPTKQEAYTVSEPSSSIDYDLQNQAVSNIQPTEDSSIQDVLLSSLASQGKVPYLRKCTSTNSSLERLNTSLRNVNTVRAPKSNSSTSISLGNSMPNILFDPKVKDVNQMGNYLNASLNTKSDDLDNSKAVALGVPKLNIPESSIANILESLRSEAVQNSLATSVDLQNKNLATTKSLENPPDNVGLYLPEDQSTSAFKSPMKYKNILENPRENLGLYLNNIQMELNSLQDVLTNLNSAELTNFCNLMETMESEMEHDDLGASTADMEIANVDQPKAEMLLGTDEPVDKDSLENEYVTLPDESDLNGENNGTNGFEGDQFTQDTFMPEVLVDEYFNTDF